MAKAPSFRRARLLWARLLWARLEEAGGISSTSSFLRLYRAYGAPSRAYHGRGHVVDVAQRVDRMSQGLPDRKRAALLVAAWYHDVVYVSRRSDNEERSADLLAAEMCRLGLDRRIISEAVRLVLVTKRHMPRGSDTSRKILADADLATLSSTAARYDAYVDAIRREYAWVPDAAYRAGRASVLRSFLDRPNLYHTRSMKRREAAARANIEREIRVLSGQLLVRLAHAPRGV